MQEEENKYKVYMIINKVTGKYYIGKTKNTLEQRFKEHMFDSSGCRRLRNSISFHGRINFCILQIGYPKTYAEMGQMEEELIIKLKARNTDIGYNLVARGIGQEYHDDETKEIISNILSGRKKDSASSQFHGVSKFVTARSVRWRSKVKVKGKNIALGSFKTEIEAAHKHNEYVIKNGLNRPLNIIDEEELRRIVTNNKKEESEKITGVNYVELDKTWECAFNYEGVKHRIGRFRTQVEGALAHNEYVMLNNLNRRLNFINQEEFLKAKFSEDIKIRGILFNKRLGKWEVNISIDKKKHYLGVYKNKIDAVLVYNKFVKEHSLNKPIVFI